MATYDGVDEAVRQRILAAASRRNLGDSDDCADGMEKDVLK
jgi:hypothetical protein